MSTTTPADMEQVPELVALAKRLGVVDSDLDPAVYELANRLAANAYNDGDLADLEDEDAYDRLHDSADAAASTVNNGGLDEQVAYLVSQMGASATETHLRSLQTA